MKDHLVDCPACGEPLGYTHTVLGVFHLMLEHVETCHVVLPVPAHLRKP